MPRRDLDAWSVAEQEGRVKQVVQVRKTDRGESQKRREVERRELGEGRTVGIERCKRREPREESKDDEEQGRKKARNGER